MQLSFVTFCPGKVAKMREPRWKLQIFLNQPLLAWPHGLWLWRSRFTFIHWRHRLSPKRVCIPCPGGRWGMTNRLYEAIVILASKPSIEGYRR
jgi:hypothetical protein